MDSLSADASFPEFKAPTTFPIQRLPMEIQLLLLQHCLVSPAPILNPSVPRSVQVSSVQSEEFAQDQINPRIIFTCRLFYKESLPLLYGHNVFMYTDSWTAFSYTLSTCDVKGCLKHGIETSSSPSPNIDHPPGAPCNWNSAFQTHATNINLRLLSPDDSDFLNECEDLLQIVDRFTNLRTLQLDFLDVCEGHEYDTWDHDERSMNRLQSTIQKTMRKIHDPNRPNGALKEICLTGLPHNGLGLYVVKQYTRLLAPHGKIGVGWGAKGRRYELADVNATAKVTKRDDLELFRMSTEEVQEWVARESEMMGISGSKWLVAGQEEPESDVAPPHPALGPTVYRLAPDGQTHPLTSQSGPESEPWWDVDYGGGLDYWGDLEALANVDNDSRYG